MKKWQVIAWLVLGIWLLVAIVALFGGWLPMFLAVSAVLFFVSVFFAWDPVRYWAARNHPWWSLWALLRENSVLARTKGDTIDRYYANPTDPEVRALLEQQRVNGSPIVLLPPGESLVWIGWWWKFGVKAWAWSEDLKFASGLEKHALRLGEEVRPWPMQLKPEERKRVEETVEEASHTGKLLPPATVEKLLDIPYLLSSDFIQVAVSLETYHSVVDPRLYFTQGEFILDKMRGVVHNALQWCMSHTLFMGQDKTPDSKLIAKLQNYLNVYFGFAENTNGEFTLPNDHAERLKTMSKWGIRLNRLLVTDAEETTGEITDAIQKKAKAEAQRDADLVAADASAQVAVRKAEGARDAQATEAEGKKKATITIAEGDKAAALLRAEGELAAGRKLAQKERILLRQQIGAFDSEGKVTEDAVKAFLEKYRYQVFGDNIQKSGRSVIMQMPGSGDAGGAGLATAITALRELFANDPTMRDPEKLTKKLKEKSADD